MDFNDKIKCLVNLLTNSLDLYNSLTKEEREIANGISDNYYYSLEHCINNGFSAAVDVLNEISSFESMNQKQIR